MADLKAMVQSMYDGISNATDIHAMLDEHVTGDFTEHEEMPGIEAASGRETAAQQISTFQRAFSNLRFNVHDLIEEGDQVVARVSVTGTHTGELMGIPASGNDVDFKAIDIFKFRDGKISDHWGVTDSGTLMMQIGAMQPPG